ncbi:MAG: hypothetical protein ABSH48_13680 [Verrucomicrobiota bacterium]|jgi:type II secretory pathway pseudopilin PulG
MNRLLFALLAAGVGVAGYRFFCHRAGNSSAAIVAVVGRWQSATNALAVTEEAVSSLRDQIEEQRARLRQVDQYPNISPEMLEILEGNQSRGHARAWAELRLQLGIGWDTSPDYVLVNKQAIRDVWFNKLLYGGTLSDDAVQLLSLSLDEQKAIRSALSAALAGQWLNVTTIPPSADVVAQYTIEPPDPAFVTAQSNAFTANITAAIGAERAGFFQPDAWRELISGLAPSEAETMTLRQTDVDGQPDLVCEVTQGANVSTIPVRYGTYPAFPILKLFPGGWQAMAQAAGFELPPNFLPANFRK